MACTTMSTSFGGISAICWKPPVEMKATDYPGWARDIFDRYDNETFSPEMLLDLPLEDYIMFRKTP
jgi:hypothetical protein